MPRRKKTNRQYLEEQVKKGTWHRGTIEAFRGSWMSGLGTLVVSGVPVYCENAPTVRALDACFRDVITEGHSVNQEAIRGKEVYYKLDDLGLVLECFLPTDDPSLEEEFRK